MGLTAYQYARLDSLMEWLNKNENLAGTKEYQDKERQARSLDNAMEPDGNGLTFDGESSFSDW